MAYVLAAELKDFLYVLAVISSPSPSPPSDLWFENIFSHLLGSLFFPGTISSADSILD